MPTILDWVEHALTRLRPRVDRLVLADLPPGLAQVGPLRYGLVRRVLVPGCRVSRDDALRRPAEVADGLARPQHRHRFGREQRTPQPSVRLHDGTTVVLY